ncbi:hypothetical protein DY245_25745 [Streptomyces inhibens]|uniref:Uncharacterized protein n=1 Tax=Streptomyces inhibens TaxID=2293571 RepID=A0A371PYP1_STRIH|nr:hypothetical protein [Streptomyces inhibens]REK87616.1 hypothetical protein DY245_25745 [Streptomyces inhibens]
MPETMVGGQYTREHDAADPDQGLAELMSGQVRGARPAFGVYRPGAEKGGLLAVTGVYGKIRDPSAALRELIRLLDRRDGDPVINIGPKTITPAGSDEPLQCRVVSRAIPVTNTRSLDMTCTWADSSTVTHVTQGLPPSTHPNPNERDLNAFAARVNQIRDEVRDS